MARVCLKQKPENGKCLTPGTRTLLSALYGNRLVFETKRPALASVADRSVRVPIHLRRLCGRRVARWFVAYVLNCDGRHCRPTPNGSNIDGVRPRDTHINGGHMSYIKPGVNFTIFLLFFGVSVIEAFQTQNWLKAIFWLAIGVVFLVADNFKPARHRE